MKKYNHAYTLAFSVDTNRHKDAPVSTTEIIPALLKRIADLTQCGEWDEALGLPWDTYENQENDHDYQRDARARRRLGAVLRLSSRLGFIGTGEDSKT